MSKSIKKYIILFVCFLSLFLLFAQASVKSLALSMLCGMVVSGILCFLFKKLQWEISIHKELLPFNLIASSVFAYEFYLRWISSSQVSILARLLHMSVETFLTIIALLLAIMAIGAQNQLLGISVEKVKGVARIANNWDKFCSCFFICYAMFFQYMALHYSVVQSMENFVKQKGIVFLLNILIVCAINLVLVLIFQNWKITLCITSCVFGIWSIANYYVILFHGSPLYISELRNTRTAFAVATDYTYELSVPVICAVFTLASELIYILKYISLGQRRFSIKKFAIRLGSAVICCILVCVAKNAITGDKEQWTTWSDNISKYGFMVCVIEDLSGSVEPIIRPEGYAVEKVSHMTSPNNSANSSEEFPDIILILNETFYDLTYYSSITPDVDHLADFYSIPNAKYGHAITPNEGGGTNNSEFELLFSKSMNLLTGAAPFMYLEHKLEERSVVQYLENLGYTTTGMHCGGENNYARDIVYPIMGFDNIFLGPEQFAYVSDNGNRSWTDEDNYRDLIDYYENADDNPQFVYLLTFQNHGGYEQNDDAMDTVHVSEDLGALTDDVNEYLSSVKLSAEAFKSLTEYYSKVDRDVIICMVGDHSPSFITELPEKENEFINDRSINARAVPYVIWSNFDLDSTMYYNYVSVVDLVPMILKNSNIPLSPFYNHICELHEVLPIRTSEGRAVDRNLEISTYDKNNTYYEMWSRYYYLEYNSLLLTDEYRENLFLP